MTERDVESEYDYDGEEWIDGITSTTCIACLRYSIVAATFIRRLFAITNNCHHNHAKRATVKPMFHSIVSTSVRLVRRNRIHLISSITPCDVINMAPLSDVIGGQSAAGHVAPPRPTGSDANWRSTQQWCADCGLIQWGTQIYDNLTMLTMIIFRLCGLWHKICGLVARFSKHIKIFLSFPKFVINIS